MSPKVNQRSLHTWQSLYDVISQRIIDGVWKPGDLIPKEVELATEFGCARATVNRALRQLANEGSLERRRKAGTRVTRYPVRKATLDIPIIRLDVQQNGMVYSQTILNRERKIPPKSIKSIFDGNIAKPLYITSLHRADGAPYAYEKRWVNIDAIPKILNENFSDISVNEWLVENALLTKGEITFSAKNAMKMDADILGVEVGAAIFVIQRSTWNGPTLITTVRLAYNQDFKMSTYI